MHLATSWRLVVPVKEAHQAKTRLSLPRTTDRAALARAMACDTIEAASRAVTAARITVVTSDPQVAPWATSLGASVVADPNAGLNDAILAGLSHWAAVDAATGSADPIAVLLGDLPALRPDDLRAALAAAAHHDTAVVPDHEGTGTVLLASRVGPGALTPSFGPASAHAHADLGATRLELDLPRLRTDADTADALAAIRTLGAGRRTTEILTIAS